MIVTTSTRNRMELPDLKVKVAPAGSSDSVILPPIVVAVVVRVIVLA